MTRPEGSLIVIEEVDNGLHPSRAGLLLQMLREIGQKRNIDVLVTTH
ncbi:MAG: AAA family ATPase, partial [Planktothrix sp.]